MDSFCLYFKIQNTFSSVFTIDFLPLSRSSWKCYVLIFIWTCRYMISFLQTVTQLNPRSVRFPDLLGLSAGLETNFHCDWPLGESHRQSRSGSCRTFCRRIPPTPHSSFSCSSMYQVQQNFMYIFLRCRVTLQLRQGLSSTQSLTCFFWDGHVRKDDHSAVSSAV